jgi:hypothetical protein
MNRHPARSGESRRREKREHALTGHEPAAPAPDTADGGAAAPDGREAGDSHRGMRGTDKSGGTRGGGR